MGGLFLLPARPTMRLLHPCRPLFSGGHAGAAEACRVGAESAHAGGWVADPSHHLKPSDDRFAERAGVAARARDLGRDRDRRRRLDERVGAGRFRARRASGLGRRQGHARQRRRRALGPASARARGERRLRARGPADRRRVGRIRDEQFFPAFKAKEFDRGMLDGVGALVAGGARGGHADRSVSSSPRHAMAVVGRRRFR